MSRLVGGHADLGSLRDHHNLGAWQLTYGSRLWVEPGASYQTTYLIWAGLSYLASIKCILHASLANSRLWRTFIGLILMLFNCLGAETLLLPVWVSDLILSAHYHLLLGLLLLFRLATIHHYNLLLRECLLAVIWDQCRLTLAVAHALHLLLTRESKSSVWIWCRCDLAGVDCRSLNPIYVLGVLREIHYGSRRCNESMLGHVCGHLYLGVAYDVIVNVVVRNDNVLPLFLTVDLVHVDTILFSRKTEIFCFDILFHFYRFRFSLAHLVPLPRLPKDFSRTIVDHLRSSFIKFLLQAFAKVFTIFRVWVLVVKIELLSLWLSFLSGRLSAIVCSRIICLQLFLGLNRASSWVAALNWYLLLIATLLQGQLGLCLAVLHAWF